MSNTDEIKKRRKEVAELRKRRFVSEGNFALMPLSFPSVTPAIPADDSYVTALAVSRDGMSVYGGTSGGKAHLFHATPKMSGGYVFDIGVVENAFQTVRVHTTDETVIAALNSESCGRIVMYECLWLHDGIQEWGFKKPDIITVAELENERILDTVRVGSSGQLICLTDKRVVRVALEQGAAIEDICPVDSARMTIRKLAATVDGSVFISLPGGELALIQSGASSIEKTGTKLPFSQAGWGWATTSDGALIATSADGTVFSIEPLTDRTTEMGKSPVAPVKCMSCLPDGRAYGMCGEGIGRFFKVGLRERTVSDLGAVGGVLGAKRYAYDFGCAAAGKDGEIYFGENDRSGHLWIYFPPHHVRERIAPTSHPVSTTIHEARPHPLLPSTYDRSEGSG